MGGNWDIYKKINLPLFIKKFKHVILFRKNEIVNLTIYFEYYYYTYQTGLELYFY